jgi:hypothetical protein
MLDQAFHVLRWTRREMDATLDALLTEGVIQEMLDEEQNRQFVWA